MMENTNKSGKRKDIMNDEAIKGKKILFVIILVILSVSAITIILYNMSGAPNKLISQGIRFVLTLVLCFYMYKGNKAAKNITAALMVFATLFGGYTFLLFHKVAILNITMFLFMTIYGIMAYSLMFSKGIKAYFEYFQSKGITEPDFSSEANISGNGDE